MLRSGFVLVVFSRSRFCLLHEKNNKLLFEMALQMTSNVFGRGNCCAYQGIKTQHIVISYT